MSRQKDTITQSDEHNARGIELADRQWLDEAINEFKKAIALDPASAHAHDNLASVYAEKKMFREALGEYLTALSLEPDSPSAHYNLACFLSSQGAEMAIAEFKEAIVADPEYPDAHLYLGLTHADIGQLEEAKVELTAAIALAPTDALARHELASVYLDEGEWTRAISMLKEVVRLEPTRAEAHLDLGIAYAQKGFYSEAERAYEAARALVPNDLMVLYNFAALYALWDKKPEALTYLRSALAQDAGKTKSWLANDPMFDGLKGTEEFEALL